MYPGERLNSLSHLVGTLLAVAALVVLVVIAARQGDPWKVVSFSIYGTTLVLLYLFSTLYHSVRGDAKRVFQRRREKNVSQMSKRPLPRISKRAVAMTFIWRI